MKKKKNHTHKKNSCPERRNENRRMLCSSLWITLVFSINIYYCGKMLIFILNHWLSIFVFGRHVSMSVILVLLLLHNVSSSHY